MRRVLLSVAAVIALALVAYPFTLANAHTVSVVIGVIAASAFLASIASGRRVLAAVAVATYIVLYALALLRRGGAIDPLAPLIAACCLLIVEAVDLGHASDVPERKVWARRAAALLVTLGVAAVVATAALVVAGSVGAGHPAWFAVGAASALGAVGLAVLMARRLLA